MVWQWTFLISLVLHVPLLVFLAQPHDKETAVPMASVLRMTVLAKAETQSLRVAESRHVPVAKRPKLRVQEVEGPHRATAEAERPVATTQSDSVAHLDTGQNSEARRSYSLTDTRTLLLESNGYVHPDYPRKARVLRQEGTLRLWLRIAEGTLVEARIIESSGHALLDHSGLTAIQQWRFRKISTSFVQQISFRLD